MTQLEVRGCIDCPFAGDETHGIFRYTTCNASCFLTGDDWRRIALKNLEKKWISVDTCQEIASYPLSPPDWCPLNKENITLALVSSEK